jgi:hypothetical protein
MTAVNFSWWEESDGGDRRSVRVDGCAALEFGITKSSDVSISTEGDIVIVADEDLAAFVVSVKAK